ncbi:Tex family protein [Halocella sp. SP3-1]|uniref:Tex family protein n=1 Tax=Halocella sp. SP3-1 TaxID=2382161 RepID=UPI0013E095BB
MMAKELIGIIADELGIKDRQVKGTVALLDEGNTIPFIARYRKEVTGGLDETQLREIEERLEYLRNLEKRKEEVIRLIDEQDKLTEELADKIDKATVLQEVEDLYRPYRQKRETRASKARQKGLEPLAELIWKQEDTVVNLEELAQEYINPELEIESISDVYQGARDIIAEMVSDNAEIRKKLRHDSFEQGIIESCCTDKGLDEQGKYEIYYEYSESLKKLPPHRVLALNRGEKEGVLQVRVLTPDEMILNYIKNEIIITDQGAFKQQLEMAIEDSYKRLIDPSIERELRGKLSEQADEHAIGVFARNLRSLLLQPPLKGHVVMGIDPGFRTGSKVCVIDSTGKLFDTATIYPHPPQNDVESSRKKITAMLKKHGVNSIAIGNGTASRETELFIVEIIREINIEVKYIIVNEAGASVYSASKIAREEFPELDVSMRGAVSIARRLQDPLAELVKIEPRSIGVGLYQHDVNEKQLVESLGKVVESAVNYVGVDLNTASQSLLQYVAGINSSVAKNIVKYREENGVFKTRIQLKEVYRLGAKTFTQAAGFLRIDNGDDPLAQTPIHPESYQPTRELLKDLGFLPEDIRNKDRLNLLRSKLSRISIVDKAKELEIGIPTLRDIIRALKQPGRDPREELPKPIFRTDVLSLADLKPEMTLQGTVRNVVDFGAFVDIGVKEDGLVHISEMSSDYVTDPLNIVNVGDIVTVKILAVDEKRKRISLTMKI